MNEDNNISFFQQLYSDVELYAISTEEVKLKDVCILLDKKLTPKTEEFISKILAAVKLSFSSVDVLLSANYSELESIDTKVLLVFDSTFLQNNEAYKITQKSTKKVLYCNSLEEINADKDLKTKLWVQLQELFLK